MKYILQISCAVFFFLLLYINPVSARNYPDQHFTWYTDSMQTQIESSAGIIYNADSSCFQLADDQTYGYMILNRLNLLNHSTADYPPGTEPHRMKMVVF